MINFELSVDEVNLILEGLHELPAKRSIVLILKLDKEASTQLEKLKENQSKKE